MHMLYQNLSIAAILCFCFISTAYGSETIDASSCSQSDVQTAINSASDGDVVFIPSGFCTWSSQVTMNKAIRLTGAGVDSTIITNNYGTSWQPVLKSVYSSGDRGIDNFSINGRGGVGNAVSIGIYGSGRFRIHNMKGTGAGTFAFIASPYGGNYGVIDHCSFEAGISNAEVIQVAPGDTGTSWAADSTFGTVNAVYIEDNVFTKSVTGTVAGHAVVGSQGARFVVRKNNIADMDIDAHGKCGSVGSTRHVEIYDNRFTVSSGKSMYRWLYMRGGTGVIYDNNMTTHGSLGTSDVTFQEFQLGWSTCPCYVGNYPAPYQIGRGKNQTLEPFYLWDNKVNGVTVGSIREETYNECGEQYTSNFVQLNRDYLFSPKPGYNAFSYPHPLTLGKENDIIAPKGLRIIQ
jgi:hypothetical protein